MKHAVRRDVEQVADGFSFIEAPRWHDGRLYFSDFHTHRVHVLERDGTVGTVCEVPGRPSGLGFDPDGRLLVVSMTDRRLLRLDGGTLHELADLSDHAPFHLNDMVVDAAGRAYVGNFGSDHHREGIRPTRLLRVDPDGRIAVAAEGLVFPNGTVIAPDGRTLVVAESFAFRLTAFDVAPDGTLSGRREWARFADATATEMAEVFASEATLADGICLDAEGAIWVAHARGSGALRVREGGEVVDVVDTGDLSVFAVALGGDDRRTLYMCAGPPHGEVDPSATRLGRLLACRVDVPGAGIP